MNTNSRRKIQIIVFLFLVFNMSCKNLKSEVSLVVFNRDKGEIFINDLPIYDFVKSKYSEVANDTLYFLALPKGCMTFKFIIQDSVVITKTKNIQGEVYLGADLETLEFQGFD